MNTRERVGDTLRFFVGQKRLMDEKINKAFPLRCQK